MKQVKVDIKKIIDLRQKLHKFPELSGQEEKTRQTIEHFFERFSPDQIIKMQYGLAFIFDSNEPGPNVVFRCDIDALPIEETNDLPYKSVNEGISHKCGHDGHTAILVGLGEAISYDRPARGKAILLFQQAEETLQGAVEIMSEPRFKELSPDYVFGYHNIPGFPENSIIIKRGEFSATVTGMKIILKGYSEHAAYKGTKPATPSAAFTEILDYLEKDFQNEPISNKTLVTLTHAQLGDPTFSLSPTYAVIHLTLRAFDDNDLNKLVEKLEEEIKIIAISHNLKWKIEYTEDTPAIFNESSAVELIKEVAKENEREIIKIHKPFPWGEDFGFYMLKYKGAYFGIGAGEDTPQLHSQDYNFPDELLFPSIEFLHKLYTKLLK